MRRLPVSLLAISFFIITLTACKSTDNVSPVTYFGADAVIISKDTTVNAKVSVNQGKNVSVLMYITDKDNPVSYQFMDGKLTISYNGLECSADSSFLPQFNPVSVIYDTFCTLDICELEYKKTTDDAVIFDGKYDNKSFTIYVEKGTGYVKKILPHYVDVQICFDNIEKK